MSMVAPPIRIIADDLTGALDAAAAFAQRHGAFTVRWDGVAPTDDARIAFDIGTREVSRGEAARRMQPAARRWWSGFAGLAFEKVDSVWRGHPAAEIAAAVRACDFEGAIVAPAFPEQGRVTRDGAQWVCDANGEQCVASDLVGDLRAEGLSARLEGAGDAFVLVCDADTLAALQAVVARHRDRGARVLWCGSAGLAHALAASFDAAGDANHAPNEHASVTGATPIVVLVGTDHPVAQAQADALAAMEGVIERWIDATAPDVHRASAANDDASIVLLRFAIPAASSRANAQLAIRRALKEVVPALPRPALAIVTGGETLRALADALGASALVVHGERATGVALAAWRDGAWGGLPLFTKSGGFGARNLLAELASIPHTPSFATRG